MVSTPDDVGDALTQAKRIYSPLDSRKREIRLVNLKPSSHGSRIIELGMETFQISVAPPFMALSYVWGNPEVTGQISLCGYTTSVTTNLVDALTRIQTLPFDGSNWESEGLSNNSSFSSLVDGIRSERRSGPPETPESGDRSEPAVIPQHLWIDALCINQADLDEKSSQIPMMYDIYEKATQVVMWLGEETADSRVAVSLISQWSAAAQIASVICEAPDPWAEAVRERFKASSGQDTVSFGRFVKFLAKQDLPLRGQRNEGFAEPFKPARWDALRSFLGRPYWRRAWILQEIVAARSGLVICGGQGLLLDDLIAAHYSWRRLTTEMAMSQDEQIMVAGSTWFRLSVFFDLRFSIPRSRAMIAGSLSSRNLMENFIGDYGKPSWESETTLEGILFETAMFEARDPLDKIYALLCLITGHTAPIQPDYRSSPSEVYTDFVISHIKSRGELSLVAMSGIGCRKSDPTARLPSWVPDFADSEWCTRVVRVTKFAAGDAIGFIASGRTRSNYLFSADSREFRAAGFFCGEIAHLEPPGDTDDNSDAHVWRWVKLAAAHRTRLRPKSPSWLCACLCTLVTDVLGPHYDALEEQYKLSDERKKFLANADAFVHFMLGNFLKLPGHEKLVHFAKLGQLLEALSQKAARDKTSELSKRALRLLTLSAALTSDYEPKSEDEVLEQMFPKSLQAELRSGEQLDREVPSNLVKFRMSCKMTRKRSFFILDHGYMGNGPLGCQIGDKICILMGCPCPIVVRQVKDGYAVVGSAYVYGMMNGEMMYRLRDGASDLKLENILIR